MLLPVLNLTLARNSDGDHVLSLTTNQLTFSGTLSREQLMSLSEAIEDILNPKRRMGDHLKQLKEFKRQVFTHYRQATDPAVKEQKLKLYLETKKLIQDLEQGM